MAKKGEKENWQNEKEKVKAKKRGKRNVPIKPAKYRSLINLPKKLFGISG